MSNTFNDRFLTDLAGLSDESDSEHKDFADLSSDSEVIDTGTD